MMGRSRRGRVRLLGIEEILLLRFEGITSPAPPEGTVLASCMYKRKEQRMNVKILPSRIMVNED